jgi:co-chaperonin GroES (HSP10)
MRGCEMTTFEPKLDYLLVRPVKKEATTTSGIITDDPQAVNRNEVEIISLWLDVAFKYKPQDHIFTTGVGRELKLNGETLSVIHIDTVLGKFVEAKK